ncbi:MAG: hypothetical protein ACRDNK_04210 [Solirubrobacteraceae bacterium]
MPEGLMTAEGEAVAGVEPVGEADFAEMMVGQRSAAAAQAEVGAPPKAEPFDADAPYGYKLDGTPKKTPGGRKPKARIDPPKTETPSSAAAAPAKRDYTRDLIEATDGLWFLLAMVPPTQAQAAVFRGHQAGLVKGFNIGAQHNDYIRQGVEYACGDGPWMIMVAAALAPFVMQSIALWTKPKATTESGALVRDELAAATNRRLAELTAESQAAFAEAAGMASEAA